MKTFETAPFGTNGLHGANASADGRPNYKVAGITILAATIAALAADLTLGDGTTIKAGKKVIPYGAIFTENAPGDWRPWDGAATLNGGQVVIINETITDDDPRFLQPPGACIGGQFYQARLKAFVTGAWTTATLTEAQLDNLTAALPQVSRIRV